MDLGMCSSWVREIKACSVVATPARLPLSPVTFFKLNIGNDQNLILNFNLSASATGSKLVRKSKLRHITVQCNGTSDKGKPICTVSVEKLLLTSGENEEDNGDNSENSSDETKEENSGKKDGLSFTRLQPTDEELKPQYKRSFDRYVAREAMLDEEYWAAAWLRAECNYENQPYDRFVDNKKKKYAEQEFNALKRRCFGRDGHSLKCFCLVAVKKEDKGKRRTVLNSVAGTLDFSIRQLLHGECFPGEILKGSVYLSSKSGLSHRYGYVANLCVAKYARRRGIAFNMLQLSCDVAKSCGLKDLYVHVHADNISAQRLYKKTGFKVVAAAKSSFYQQKEMLLLSLSVQS